MSIRRVLRLFFGLVIAFIVLPLVLPVIGVPKSRFLPPTWVYQQAQGKTLGRVTKVYDENSNNPFHIGEKIHLIDYQFMALPPEKIIPGKNPAHADAGQMIVYKGTIRVDSTFNAAEDESAPVKYEYTNPDVNGIDFPGAGLGCRGASAPFGGWLVYSGFAVFLGFLLMLLFDKIGTREDF